MKKYIFLDIDGVLNSYEVCELNKDKFAIQNGFGGFFTEEETPTLENVLWGENLVQNLKFIVDATDAKIIISSTWRLHFSVEKFKEMFALYGYNHCPIIDLTPTNLPQKKLSLPVTRGDEIEKWLEDKKDYNYCIIDDNDQFLNYQKPYFIYTNMMKGLTKQDAMKAIKILNQ